MFRGTGEVASASAEAERGAFRMRLDGTPLGKGGIEGEWPLANLGWSKLAWMTRTGV